MAQLSDDAGPIVIRVPLRRTLGPRIAFLAVALATGWGAFAPRGLRPPDVLPTDGAEHFAAFFLLAASAMAAFPRQSQWSVSLLAALAGGAVELIQATPWIARDAELSDWLWDCAACAAAWAIAWGVTLPLRSSK